MTAALDPQDILPDGARAGDVIGGTFDAAICLVCEHAASAIPPHMNDLGLEPEDRHSHAVFDIGANALALEMQSHLNAPFVVAEWSRLIYDLNRPPESTSAMPDRVEEIDVPGNRNLSSEARTARAKALYHPFHALLSDTLDRFATPPALVTIHSFTPVWYGQPRETEIGFLHDADPSLAEAMLADYAGPHRVELNQPYSARDGVTHTLEKHGTARGLKNVMIEVRSDLLTAPDGTPRIANDLSKALMLALETVAA